MDKSEQLSFEFTFKQIDSVAYKEVNSTDENVRSVPKVEKWNFIVLRASTFTNVSLCSMFSFNQS